MDKGNSLLFINDYKEFVGQATILMSNLPEGQRYAVMYVDITDFQMVNDFYGFAEGNRFLDALGNLLATLPHTQLCGRVFSDHFLRLAKIDEQTDVSRYTDMYQDKMRAFLEEQQKYHANCRPQIACGYCTLSNGVRGLFGAIDDANIARKEAKATQRTMIVSFDSAMRDKIKKNKAMEVESHRALAEEEFCFFLQPKVNLHTGKIIGAEALARWIKEDGRMIYPDEFIPIMEHNGSILELDILVYRKVCAYLRDRIRKGEKVVPISVNLSRMHLYQMDIAAKVHEIAVEYEIPPYLLDFEMTETVLLEDFAVAKTMMDRLMEHGYKTSIDDFGSGFTGLNIWKDLNFNVLKLDKVFISQDPKDSIKNDTIVASIVAICNKMRNVILCEGVETLEQALHMKDLGCDIAQGYYFSKPVPPQEFDKRLEEHGGVYELPWAAESEQGKYINGFEAGEITQNQMERITHSLLHIIPCGMAGVEENSNKLIFLSDRMLEMLGYTREEYKANKEIDWPSLMFPITAELRSQSAKLREKYAAEGYISVEYMMKRREGNELPVSLYAARVSAPEYGAYELCCFFDETQRKSAEKAAFEMRSKLALLAESMHGGAATLVLNDDFRILNLSETCYRITGYSREELLELTQGYGAGLLPEEDLEWVKKSVERVLDGKQDHVECRLRKKDGGISWNAAYLISCSLEGKELIGEVLFFDITKDKEYEIKKKRLDQFYKEIYNTVDCAIIQYREEPKGSGKFTCLNMNNYALQMFGFSCREELWEGNLDIINDFILPGEIQESQERIAGLKEPGDAVMLDFCLRRLDGKLINVSGTLKIMKDQDGNNMYLAVLVDNSEKRNAAHMRYLINTVLDKTPGDVVIIGYDEEGIHTEYLSYGLAENFGCTREEFKELLIQNNGLGLLEKQDRERVEGGIRRCMEERKPIDINFRAIYRNGVTGWHNLAADFHNIDENGTVKYHGIITDITKMKEQENEIRSSNLRYQTVSELLGVDMFSYNFQTGILNLPVTEQISHLELGGRVNIKLEDFIKEGYIHPDYTDHYLSIYNQPLNGEDYWEVELPAKLKDNGYKWFRIKSRIVSWIGSEPAELVGVAVNIDDERARRRNYRNLQKSASLDPLTGVYNRNHAQKLIQAKLAVMRKGTVNAFLMLDIDNFKIVNDRYGHQTGDFLLKEISRGIESLLPPHSILGRLGGDEFIIYIPNASYESDIYQLARSICAMVNAMGGQEEDRLFSVSIGLSFAGEGMDFAELYRRADEAMYQVKKNNKNDFRVYNDNSGKKRKQ